MEPHRHPDLTQEGCALTHAGRGMDASAALLPPVSMAQGGRHVGSS